ncbi:unnamed protein product [Chrysoparadoxa australica]
MSISTPLTYPGMAFVSFRWREPLRHALLRLRVSKPNVLSGKQIPLLEEEIRKDEGFERVLVGEMNCQALQQASEGDTADPATEAAVYEQTLLADKRKERIAVDKSRLNNFVTRVRNSKTAQARQRQKKRATLTNVLKEVPVPELDLGGGGLGDLLPPKKRALRPRPKARTATAIQVDSCRLLIQIIGARNIPVRAAEDLGGFVAATAPADDEEEGMIGEGRQVHSYVEVRFQNCVKRTHTCSGVAPLWKETLTLPFHPPSDDFGPVNVSQVNEQVMVSLFDEVEYDDRPQGGYIHEDESAIRIEKHFLGSCAIPLQTIYMQGRVEGLFRINTPAFNLGYEHITSGHEPEPIERDEEDVVNTGLHQAHAQAGGVPSIMGNGPAAAVALTKRSDRSTYVKVMVTLDPVLVTPDKEAPAQGSTPGLEAMARYHERWLARVKSACPEAADREVVVFVPDMFGNEVLVTRYLTPQEPPAELTTICHCKHFVQLIPFLEDWQAFDGDVDMWCTSQQFLDILGGDWEEHSILLHNYIAYLARKSQASKSSNKHDKRLETYIAIGKGMPEGETVYVMLRELDGFGDVSSIVFWNSCTGEGYDRHDRRCPLTEIGCLVSENNVWANVQRVGRPWELNFDLSNTKCWRPFFSEPLNPKPPMPTVQAALSYRQTEHQFVYEVEELIRETIKKEMRAWRANRSHTAFNADISNRLAELLPRLEDTLLGQESFDAEEHQRLLELVMRSRDLVGFPLHCSFTDVDTVVSMVKATGIHQGRHPDVTFALAVQAFAYPCNVLSVWVYVACITPR